MLFSLPMSNIGFQNVCFNNSSDEITYSMAFHAYSTKVRGHFDIKGMLLLPFFLHIIALTYDEANSQNLMVYCVPLKVLAHAL